jgi:DHA1 family bicyclomycin/chloramphenicol resistance-like MFS transporter
MDLNGNVRLKPRQVHRPGVVVAALVMASSASIMSTDMYVPSLPHLAGYFGTTPEAVKLTVSLNVIAFGLAQLLFGPLSDRLGRRPVMLTGMIGFCLATVACAGAPSIGHLIAARIFQGITASVEMVLALAIIHDQFAETERVRVLAVYGMVVALAPALAPVFGGYIHVHLGWRANFWLVAAAVVLIIVLLWRVLPRSDVSSTVSLKPLRMLQAYAGLLREPRFMNYVLMLGCCEGLIFAFITSAPFILISIFGVPTQHYGYYQGVVVLAFFTGSLTVRQTVTRTGPERMLRIGLVVIGLGSALIVMPVAMGTARPVLLTAAMAVAAFGMGPVFAIAPMRAMDATRRPSGTASAMMSACQMLTGGLASAAVGLLHDGTMRPLAWTVTGLLAIAGWAFGRSVLANGKAEI